MYLQIDGGPENTAKAMFFICELLVVKRLTKRIVLSRLQVGHTHCDIDAVFGRLWKRLRVTLLKNYDLLKLTQFFNILHE